MTETTDTVDQVLKLVEKAQAKGTFNITEFAKGRGYPEDSVVAYLDIDAAYRLQKLTSQMSLGLATEDELAVLEAEANELADRIKASKVIFNMRGVNQAYIEKISSDCDKKYPTSTDALGQQVDNPEWLREWTVGLVAANLASVENAAGELDQREFTAEDVMDMRNHLPREVWDLLVEKMQQLTLAGAYFKGLTDAGFLPKS